MRSAASMPKTYEQLDIFESSMSPAGVKQAVRYLFSPGAAPEHISSLGADSSGWLERYSVTRASRKFEYWRWCYRMDGKIRHHHVPSGKYVAIAYLINQRSPITEIRTYLKRPLGL
jgi:hypothetical protein